MDSSERHELEQNTLALWLEGAGRQIRPLLPMIGLGAVALAVAVIVIVSMQAASNERQQEAWASLARANSPEGIEQVLSDHPDSPLAPYGMMRLGWIRFSAGKEEILEDRGEAIRLLDEAKEYFEETVANRYADDSIVAQAELGIALVHENQGKLKQAKEDYQALIDRYRGQPVADVAEQRFNLLDTPEANTFFAGLKEYQPTTPTTDLPAQIEPSFNLDSPLPSAPEIPGSLDMIKDPLVDPGSSPVIPPSPVETTPEKPTDEPPTDEAPAPTTEEPEAESAAKEPETKPDPPAEEPKGAEEAPADPPSEEPTSAAETPEGTE